MTRASYHCCLWFTKSLHLPRREGAYQHNHNAYLDLSKNYYILHAYRMNPAAPCPTNTKTSVSTMQRAPVRYHLHSCLLGCGCILDPYVNNIAKRLLCSDEQSRRNHHTLLNPRSHNGPDSRRDNRLSTGFFPPILITTLRNFTPTNLLKIKSTILSAAMHSRQPSHPICERTRAPKRRLT